MATNSETIVFEHADMIVEFEQVGDQLCQSIVNCSKDRKDRLIPVPSPNFQLAIAGLPRLISPPPLAGISNLPYEMKLVSAESSADGIRLRYSHEKHRFAVVVQLEFIQGVAAVRQTATFVNESDSPLLLTHFSSALWNGIATDGDLPWQDKRKIRVHYCRQTWHGEGQWRVGDLEELGVYHTSVHPPNGEIRFSSVGSFSTGRYLPMIVIEDMETRKVWYVQMQIEASASWNLEIGFRGSWTGSGGALYLQADAGSERYGGWKKQVLPGEAYTSVPTAFGCAPGDFNDAVRELTRYRRTRLKPDNAWSGEFPLVFNDYMNCIWGNPTRDKLMPLIEAAAVAGTEVFCIDAGWFMEHSDQPVQRLGVWMPAEERFGEGGLSSLLKEIQSRGMMPGLWLEIEACHADTALAAKPDDWFLFRDGRRIGGPDRIFLNFANPGVREFCHSVMDRLVKMGVGYIKNDYNDFIAIADSSDGASVDGIRENMDSFCSFIDEVRLRHPQLILENCGSGAMRSDNGILSHFHVQSTSDQSIYTNYPSIIQGSLAGMLPEQAGIWAYPYPVLYLDYAANASIGWQEDYFSHMADGEQTVFNMINGMCGNMVLSGRIDRSDKRNMALIQEGAAVYKRERSHIRESYPIYPTGLQRILDKQAWATLGLWDEQRSRLLLAVWRFESECCECAVPLERWIKHKFQVRQLYPVECAGYDVPIYCDEGAHTVTFRLERQMSARLFEIVVPEV